MELKSVFKDGEPIPQRYTCDGEDISPPLRIFYTPSEAKSLVLIVDDPDAPSKNFTHWLLCDIPPSIIRIEEGSVPEGATEGLNDFGENGYGGPCPPTGTHKYVFKIYALDKMLGVSSKCTRAEVEKEIEGHVIESASLTGDYCRNDGVERDFNITPNK